MHAVIKYIHSPDIKDLPTYKPEDSESFSFLLQVMVGPNNQEGEESFDIEVVTPKYLLEKYDDNEILIGRHRLIVFRYDWNRIMHTVNRYCESCTGETWDEIAEKVGRLGRWEFEDYVS
jgi:hypothetical protein